MDAEVEGTVFLWSAYYWGSTFRISRLHLTSLQNSNVLFLLRFTLGSFTDIKVSVPVDWVEFPITVPYCGLYFEECTFRVVRGRVVGETEVICRGGIENVAFHRVRFKSRWYIRLDGCWDLVAIAVCLRTWTWAKERFQTAGVYKKVWQGLYQQF